MSDLAKIEELYHAALELASAEREKFLREVCGNDAELYRELTSLVSNYESAGDFIESPPEDVAAAFLAGHADRDLIGKQFNHYKVLCRLGMGGMGEVFLAQDISLGRNVALKILPSQFSHDPERKLRFEQEARAISALNHPNIITIHGIEQADDFNFIATEFIEGQTLRDKISEGPMNWQEAAKIGVQIAGALASAHSVGIIHRDIKPANIMIRQDGYVKVLDFGLAKLTQSLDSSDPVEQDHTGENRVMGTIKYMSPEQALGEKLDTRTDIFSLGVVLYEMLTGVQPFNGQSDAAVYNATINKNPPRISNSNPDVSPMLEQIVEKALEKDRDERYQSASDLQNDLITLGENSNSIARQPGGKAKPRRAFLLQAAAATSVAAMIWGAFYFYTRRGANALATEFKNLSYTRATDDTGDELFPGLSPDGKTLIYASRATGNWDIYVRRVGGKNPQNLTGDSTAEDTQPALSPDGERIAFRSERTGGGIFVMGATGENPRRVADFGFNPTWSPDGKEIAVSEEGVETFDSRAIQASKLWAINVETGQRRLVTDFDTVQPAWSPNGKFIAFWTTAASGQRDLGLVLAGGGEAIKLTNDAPVEWNPVWSPDGDYLYFASNRGGNMNLWRVAIDRETGKATELPEAMTIPTDHGQHFAFTRDGKHFVYVQNDGRETVRRIGFDAAGEKTTGNPEDLIRGKQTAVHPAVSPDGEWIVFSSAGDLKEDLFIVRKDGSGLRQLTDDMAKDRLPRWSPDGKKIAFYSDRSGSYEIWTVNPDGGELKAIAGQPGTTHRYPFWSPDGKRMAFIFGDQGTRIFNLETPYSEQAADEVPLLENGSVFEVWSWSPDGKYLAGNARNSAGKKNEMLLYSPETHKFRKLSDNGSNPAWLSDSRRILFFIDGNIQLMDIQTGRTRRILSMSAADLGQFELSRDDRTIYFGAGIHESDIWMATAE